MFLTISTISGMLSSLIMLAIIALPIAGIIIAIKAIVKRIHKKKS